MLFFLLGCDLLSHDCTLMYAPNTFTLAMDVATEGVWAWTISAGDASTSCSVTLPDGADIACTGDTFGVEAAPTDFGWTLTTTFTPPGDAIDVALIVTLDGVEVATETFTPDWNVSEPNGEGCGETISAGDEIDLREI